MDPPCIHSCSEEWLQRGAYVHPRAQEDGENGGNKPQMQGYRLGSGEMGVVPAPLHDTELATSPSFSGWVFLMNYGTVDIGPCTACFTMLLWIKPLNQTLTVL